MATNDIFTYSQTNTSLFEAFGFKLTSQNVRSVKEAEETTEFLKFKNENALEDMEKASYKAFDPNNPYHAYVNQIDMERIFIYGVPIRYYPVLEKEQQQFYNDTYGETRDRYYKGAMLERDDYITRLTETNPIILWGTYKSEVLNQELTEFQLDASKTATFTFNILYFRKMIGRDPNIGDIILPWDMPEFVYEVTKAIPDNKVLHVPKSFTLSSNLIQFSK
jgi:hypothetical protein